MATNAAAYGKGLRHILLPNTSRCPDGGLSTRGAESASFELWRWAVVAVHGLTVSRLGHAEKAANRLGKLQFIWGWGIAVLLGGFASALNITDFRCITVNLVSEGARIFIRSYELEWQHHAAQTSTARAACCAPAYQLIHALLHPGVRGGVALRCTRCGRSPDPSGSIR